MRKSEGFSLVEVVVALGVISFALVAIIGMFPIAMSASKDSRNETRSAFITQFLLGQIKAQSPTNSSFPVGPDPTSTSSSDGFVGLNLKENGSYFAMFNEQGRPVRRSTAQQFNDGAPAGFIDQADFLTRMTVEAESPTNGLSKITIDVTYPGAAPLSNRQTSTFVTLLRNTQ